MSLVCPYCGHAQQAGDRCRKCGGRFGEKSLLATHMGMGPWRVRNETRPFLPGFCMDVLRKQIKNGQINRQSILAGPTTHQFWTPALKVPGVAHLLGQCHACAQPVDANDITCPHCQAIFVIESPRWQLGIPDKPVSQALTEHARHNDGICPVCCSQRADEKDCFECSTVFAPPERASNIALGPWFVRDKIRAYRIGIHRDELLRKIETGEVNKQTILRGPTTNQLWMCAVYVPGIARFFGRCHACQQPTTSDAQACSACGASFALPGDANDMGFLFPTDEHAKAVRKKHKEQQHAGAQSPVASQPSDQTQPTGAAVTPPREPATPVHVAEAHAASASEEQAAFELDSAASKAAAGRHQSSGPTAGHSRHTRRKRKKSSPILSIIVVGFCAAVLIGVLVFIVMRQQNQSTAGQTARTGQPANATSTSSQSGPTNAPSADAVAADASHARAKAEIDAHWVRIENAAEETADAGLLSQARAMYAQIQSQWSAGQYQQAAEQFPQMQALLRQIDDQINRHTQVQNAKDDAQRAADSARQVDAPQYAAVLWQQAEESVNAAQQAAETGDAARAVELYNAAAREYAKAGDSASLAFNAREMKNRFHEDATRQFSLEQLQTAGQPAWNELLQLIEAGDMHFDAEEYELALQQYRQAYEGISRAEQDVQREIGANYYAFHAGYMVAHTLMAMTQQQQLDDAQRQALHAIFADLKLQPNPVDAVAAERVDFTTLANILVTQTAQEIGAQRGRSAQSSFSVGFEFRTLERLLKLDPNNMTRGESGLLERTINNIESAARAAGYGPDMQQFINDLRQALANPSREESFAHMRQLWSQMMLKLNDYATAHPVVQNQ